MQRFGSAVAGIYIHIPYCKSLCSYCDFYSTMSGAENSGTMTDALCHELEARSGFLSRGRQSEIETIYIGGGTPSLLSSSEIGRLIRKTISIFDAERLKEVTVEANPDDLTGEYLHALREEGVNRLSIGIQSFNDSHLRWMNRRHDASQAIRAVKEAQKAGFDNISADIIYGLPMMTDGDLRAGLDTLLGLGVQHISAYHLTIEPNSVLGKRARKGEFSPIDDNGSRLHYDIVHSTLSDAGFDHYEISNFALPGRRSLHNSNYWNGTEYLGVGPSAHSFNGTQRQWNVRSNSVYLRNIRSGSYYETETLDDKDHYNEYVMTSLRTREGIDTKTLSERFGARKLQYFISASEKFLRQGTLCKKGMRYYIPPEQFLISDAVICELFIV